MSAFDPTQETWTARAVTGEATWLTDEEGRYIATFHPVERPHAGPSDARARLARAAR